MTQLRAAFACTTLLLSACALQGDSEPSAFDAAADTLRPCTHCNWGPPLLNSHGLNGVDVAALDVNGLTYGGWRLLEVVLPGDPGAGDRPLHSVHAVDGVIYGTDPWGVVFSGADLIGSRWTVEVTATGIHEIMEIVEFQADPVHANYTFIVSDTAGGTPDPKFYTCPEDDETGSYAAVVFDDIDVDPDTGTHEPRANTLYFGCINSAVGKAAMWGYSPWATDDVMHQTASRTVRADYCGNGDSYTVTGTELQVTDEFGINEFGNSASDTEALWGPDGALCIKAPRVARIEDVDCGKKTLPFCSADEGLKERPDALLWTKQGY